MDRLQRSMNLYVKWLGRRGEASEDKEKGLPVSYLGRTMINHGEEFQADSEFGNCLIAMGRANERVSAIQETFVSEATNTWLESLERSLAMMKEYQVSVDMSTLDENPCPNGRFLIGLRRNSVLPGEARKPIGSVVTGHDSRVIS